MINFGHYDATLNHVLFLRKVTRDYIEVNKYEDDLQVKVYLGSRGAISYELLC